MAQGRLEIPCWSACLLLAALGGCGDGGSICPQRWYLDHDGDGYGHPNEDHVGCLPPQGYVGNNADCLDRNASAHPEADERCNQLDDDCDGQVDEQPVDAPTWYADQDDDGYGDATASLEACQEPGGYVAKAGDCDDALAYANPDRPERCNGRDDDCDGALDEDDALDAATWLRDEDGDGFGDPATTTQACQQPSGYVASEGERDCDDLDAQVHPGAEETPYDGVDADCDGGSDYDADGDGQDAQDYGGTDCDDQDALIHSGAEERCNGLDDDCDGQADEDPVESRFWFQDDDADGYGDAQTAVWGCLLGSGWVSDGSDCDDGDAAVNPAARDDDEDGLDDDCDGLLDNDRDLALADAQLAGVSVAQRLGSSVAMGDFDGDGLDELLLGAPGDGAGAAWLVTGPWVGHGAVDTLGVALEGVAGGDDAGCAVAAAGDVDGDGFTDLLVGADLEAGKGAAYLLRGPLSQGVSLATAQATLRGEYASDYAGFSVAGLGDADGDGLAELAVGGWGFDGSGTDGGGAWIWRGSLSGELDMGDADVRLEGAADHDYAGTVAGRPAGGAWGEDSGGACAGAAYLLLGPVEGAGSLVDADGMRTGESAMDLAGWAVSGVGDVNGDGRADYAVGALAEDEGACDAGAAYVVLGPGIGGADLASADAKLLGVAAGDGAGGALVAAGDVYGTGFDDILVGAAEAEGGSGAAYLVLAPLSGSLSLAEADTIVFGEAAGDQVGGSLAVGDADGDGSPDLLIGAPGESSGGSGAGAGYLLLGPWP